MLRALTEIGLRLADVGLIWTFGSRDERGRQVPVARGHAGDGVDQALLDPLELDPDRATYSAVTLGKWMCGLFRNRALGQHMSAAASLRDVQARRLPRCKHITGIYKARR